MGLRKGGSCPPLGATGHGVAYPCLGGNGGRRISIEPGCTRFAVDTFSEAPLGATGHGAAYPCLGGKWWRGISIEPGCTRFAVDAFSEAPKGRPKVAQGNALGFRPPIHFSPEGAHQSLNQQNQTGRPSTPSNPQRHTVTQTTPWDPSTGTNRGPKVRPQCLTIRPGLQPSGIFGWAVPGRCPGLP